MRDAGQSVKVKSHSSPFIALRLVIQRAVDTEHVLVEPKYGIGSVLVGFSLSFFSPHVLQAFHFARCWRRYKKNNKITVLKRLSDKVECFSRMETFE